MKKLESLTVAELRKLAKEEGITGYSQMRRPELINLIETVRQEAQAKKADTPRKSRQSDPPPVAPEKAAANKDVEAKGTTKTEAKGNGVDGKVKMPKTKAKAKAKAKAAEPKATELVVQIEEPQPPQERPHPFEHGKPLLAPLETGEVPYHYEDRFLYGMARTPTSILFVWSMGEAELAGLDERHTQLRISDTTNGSSVVRHETIDVRAGRWYVHNLEPDREYFVELGWVNAEGFHVALVGGTAVVPPDRQSRVVDPVYVRLDFDRVHLIAGDLRAVHKMRSFLTDRNSGLTELEHAAATGRATESAHQLPPRNESDPGEFQSWNSSRGGRPTSRGF